MNKRRDDFYRDKRVIEIEWWLHSCDLPKQRWARLRVFNDGTADTCFGPADTLLGFETREYAGHILSEDEYIRLNSMDHEDESEYGITLTNLVPTKWPETNVQGYKYLGSY